MRRNRKRLAIENALFTLVRGSAWDVAEAAGCPVGNAAAHLNRMAAQGMVGWSKLFLPTGGEPRYAAASARIYQLTPRGRMVVGAVRVLVDDIDYLVYEDEIPRPEEFEGIESLIMTGYMQVGATEGIR